jgi:hypothetical protein
LKSIIPFPAITRGPFKEVSHPKKLDRGTSQKMKVLTAMGILLTAIGVISLIYQEVTFTTREKVIEFGPLQAYREKNKTIPLPPIIGVLSIAAGILLIVSGVRKK